MQDDKVFAGIAFAAGQVWQAELYLSVNGDSAGDLEAQWAVTGVPRSTALVLRGGRRGDCGQRRHLLRLISQLQRQLGQIQETASARADERAADTATGEKPADGTN